MSPGDSQSISPNLGSGGEKVTLYFWRKLGRMIYREKRSSGMSEILGIPMILLFRDDVDLIIYVEAVNSS